MARYKPYKYDQMVMVPVSFQDQLKPGTLEHSLHELVEHHLDVAVFEARYQNDHTGARAIYPKILLKVILFAYSRGMISSMPGVWQSLSLSLPIYACKNGSIIPASVRKPRWMCNGSCSPQSTTLVKSSSMGECSERKHRIVWRNERLGCSSAITFCSSWIVFRQSL